MAGNIEIGIANGYRASRRREDGTLLYCESLSPESAALWLEQAETLNRIETLPEGVTLGSSGLKQLRFRHQVPFGFDFHWVREIALDVLRGTTGFRLDAGVHAMVTASIDAPFDFRISRTGGRLRLQINSSVTRSGGLELKATALVNSEIAAAPPGDSLLAALAGIHPLEWIRSMLSSSGSRQWRDFAIAANIRSRLLDAIHSGWSEMSARSEAAVWHALGDQRQFDGLIQAARAAAAGDSVSPEPGSAAEEWLLAYPLAETAAAARSLLSWLDNRELAEAAFTLRDYALSVLDPNRPADWAEFVLAEQAGGRPGAIDPASILRRWTGLRDSIYAAAGQALNRKLAAELTAGVEAAAADSSILDVSFPASPHGAAALREAVSGNLDSIFAPCSSAEVHHSLLAAFRARRSYLDLHMPFLGRKQYWHTLDAVASASVVNEGVGRIAVYSLQARERAQQSGVSTSTAVLAAAVSERDGQARCDNLNLSFEHRFACPDGRCSPAWKRVLQAYRVMPRQWPSGVSEAILTITSPASHTLVWTRTPHPSNPGFNAALGRLSTAVQLTMRRWLPALYFSRLDRYENLAAARPLLVYAASRPFCDPAGRNYSYDSMDPKALTSAAVSAAAALPAILDDTRQLLLDAGLVKKAAHYVPYLFEGFIHDARRRPQFAALLRADAFLVQDMVRLTETGRELRNLWTKQPRTVIRRLATDGAYFVSSFNRRLKRLYAGSELLALGPLVLAEATTALSGESALCQARLEFVGPGGSRLFWTN